MCRILGQSLARAPAAIKRSHGAPATGENTAGIGGETGGGVGEREEGEKRRRKRRSAKSLLESGERMAYQRISKISLLTPSHPDDPMAISHNNNPI